MVKNLHISFLLLIFAKGIVGFGHPMTREYLIPPFPFNKDKIIERISNMSRQLTNEEFIKRAHETHGDKYGYSLVEYVDTNTKVKIICPEHGVFEQTPKSHLKGHGCAGCAGCKKMTNEEFKTKAIAVHGNKYDYSLIDYVNNHQKVKIVCNAHGAFYQDPSVHLAGFGCPRCSNTAQHTNESFIKKAKEIHGDKYDYSLIDYKNAYTKIHVKCNTCGNVFDIRPYSHLSGRGCSICTISRGEERIKTILTINNIVFEQQRKIKNSNLFCTNIFLIVDFYLPQQNAIIEFNGEQHYKAVKHFGGNAQFEKQQERDMALRQYCKEHGIKLIEIPYTEYDNIETILKNELLK